MADTDATLGVTIPIVMPTLYCAVGQVIVASLWSPVRPRIHLWRTPKPVRSHPWKTTQLPDARSGGF
jgi:hypothetical protein